MNKPLTDISSLDDDFKKASKEDKLAKLSIQDEKTDEPTKKKRGRPKGSTNAKKKMDSAPELPQNFEFAQTVFMAIFNKSDSKKEVTWQLPTEQLNVLSYSWGKVIDDFSPEINEKYMNLFVAVGTLAQVMYERRKYLTLNEKIKIFFKKIFKRK